MFADYKCEKCNKLISYRKPYKEEFPVTIICDEVKCNGNCKRQYSRFTMSIGGFDSLGVYHPAPLSPMNKVFGGYGRIAGVEAEDSNY